MAVRKFFTNGKCLVCENGWLFWLMQGSEKKRRFVNVLRQQFAQAQTNGRLPIQLKKTHCELAEKHPFFETLQSCVRSTAALSHRFKSSPAIPGNLVVFNATGYMMMAGHFSENYVSSGDLNRPRSPEVRKPLGYFWFFSYKRKE